MDKLFYSLSRENCLPKTVQYSLPVTLGEYFYNDTDTLIAIVGKSFYDQYGNIKNLSLSNNNGTLSEFEEKIIDIYRVRDNG